MNDELEEEWKNIVEQRYGGDNISASKNPKQSKSTSASVPNESNLPLPVFKGPKDRVFQRNPDGSTRMLGSLAEVHIDFVF